MVQDVSDKYLGQFVETLSQRLVSGPKTPAQEEGRAAAAARSAHGLAGAAAEGPAPSPPAAPEINVAGMAAGVLVRRYPLQLAGLGLAVVLLALRVKRG
jgi:hypothetical protein